MEGAFGDPYTELCHFKAMSNWVLNVSREMETQCSLGQCLNAVIVRKFPYFMVKQHFLYSILCPLPLVLSLDTSEKSVSVPFIFSNQVFRHMDKIFPSLLLPRLHSPRSLSPSSLYERCSSILINFIVLHWPFSSVVYACLVCGSPELSPALHMHE